MNRQWMVVGEHMRVTCQAWVLSGDTFAEAEELIRDGIVLHLAGLAEDGPPIPLPTGRAERVTVQHE